MEVVYTEFSSDRRPYTVEATRKLATRSSRLKDPTGCSRCSINENTNAQRWHWMARPGGEMTVRGFGSGIAIDLTSD